MMQFAAEFSLFRVFTSHMVLQRQKPVVISGRAEPGKAVSVTFAGIQQNALAAENGQWQAEFPAMEAGGPWKLTLRGAEGTAPVELDDILIGEVWLCSGQSNMEMPVYCDAPFFRIGGFEKELHNADHPQLRFFDALPGRRLAPEAPLADVSGEGWRRCTAETLAPFSACGYFFGRQLRQDMNVPVGLIATAWGGSDIISWISKEKIESGGYIPGVGEPEEYRKSWLAQTDALRELQEWIDQFDACGSVESSWLLPGFDDSAWRRCAGRVTELPQTGRYVCRYTFVLPQELENCDFSVETGIVSDTDQTYFNGRKIGATGIGTPNYWSVSRKYTVPAGCAQPGRNTIAVIADNHYCIGTLQTGELKLSAGECEYTVQPVCRIQEVFVLPEGFPIRPAPPCCSYRGPDSQNYPSTLFNSMINPWLRYRIRGILWYQGCENNGQFSYYRLHQMLIDDWREKWNEPEMPFLLVQLAAFHQHSPETPLTATEIDALPIGEYPPYAVTREIQAEMPRCRKNVGMVVSFDRGDASDIHPRDKETVGFRLAKKAEKMVYGAKIAAEGPEFAGFRQERTKLRVFFHNTGGGLMTCDGEAPLGFVLGDRNGKLKPAQARIEEDSVVLESPEIAEPQYVRYAFTGYCRVNLYNKEGFPAQPFRSDKVDYTQMYGVPPEDR